MRRFLSLSALLLLACSGLVTVPEADRDEAAAPVPDPPPATAPATGGDCGALIAGVRAATEAAAVCTTDADCRIERVDRCGLPGLDCHSVHVGTGDFALVEQALADLAAGCREARRCRCGNPQATACVAGRCQRPGPNLQ